MLKIKLPKLKKEKKKNDSSLNPIIFIIIGALLGVFLYVLSKNLLLFPLSLVLTFSIYFIYSESQSSSKMKNKENEDKKERIMFYKNFVDYSLLLSSYKEGFFTAKDKIERSRLKDYIEDYLENKENGLQIKEINTQKENHIFDLILRYENSDEEISFSSLKSLKEEINKLEIENSDNENYMTIPIIFSLIFAVFLISCSILTRK